LRGVERRLIAMMLALGAMSIPLMICVTVTVSLQKLLSPQRYLDVTLALAIVAFGVLVAVAPSAFST
jgi:predicted metal-binding membrane protein